VPVKRGCCSIADRATRACIWNVTVQTIFVFKYVSLFRATDDVVGLGA